MVFREFASDPANEWLLFLVIVGCLVTCGLYVHDSRSKIPNVFLIPSFPIVGSLFHLRKNPALTFMKWSKKYNQMVFQVKLGHKYVVVVNSFADVNTLWNKHACGTKSRPRMYTFHDVVSTTQGFTIGSTPFSASCVRAKKALAANINHMAIDSHIKSIIDQCSTLMVKKLFMSNRELLGPPSCNIYLGRKCTLADIDMLPYAQFFTIQSSVLLAFGINLDCYKKDISLAKEIIRVESQIMKLRSHMGNWRDFIPILRSLSVSRAEEARNRRDYYMDYLRSILDSNLGQGMLQESIVGKLKLQHSVNESVLKSISLTLISAGLDNTPLNFNHLMGHLSHKYGAKLQDRAFTELLQNSNNDIEQAWEDSAGNMDCHFVLALIHETLRYFTVLPLSLPRATTKAIDFTTSQKKTLRLPPSTIVFMNAYAANHDESVFKSPYLFLPERWLNKDGKINTSLKHFAFGAGSRKCSGNILALQELYTLTCRTILAFKIRRPVGNNLMELDPFKNNLDSASISFDPKVFRVQLKPRIHNGSDKLYYKIMRS